MNIEHQLRLLREGSTIESDDQDLDLDDELTESWFINTNNVLSESVIATPIADLVLEMAMLVESGTATPDETLGFIAKVKAKVQKLKTKFDAFEGLEELKMITTRAESLSDYRKAMIFLGPILGTVVFLNTQAKKYKDMDPNMLKQYLAEAEKFRGVIYNQIKKAQKNNDTHAVERLTRISKKLDTQIMAFKNDVKGFGHHDI